MQMTDQDLRLAAFQLFGKLVSRADPGRIDVWAGMGLTLTQLRALFILRSEDGLRAGGLAERLGVTASTLTRVMDRLVRNHLVRREPDEEDRRLVRHFLTASGQEAVVEIERTGRERMNRIFDRLTASQLERLVEALQDMTAAADQAYPAEQMTAPVKVVVT